ncbi:MAG: chemotaxis protein CheY [Clostridiaceae bacterium BRH_c20a]|nr:MAG: chemotaxis protein CheY [Clostridiaceae bacterium BRH_c20a]
MDFEQLNCLQKDALKEIGNIGAGNAATALSTLLNKKINMSVPNIFILPFSQVVELMGGDDTPVAGGYLQVEAKAPMSILFVIPEESLKLFLKILVGKQETATITLDELDISALKEVTNILAGSYLTALSGFTNMEFNPSVPALAFDMVGAILGNVLQLYGEVSDYALVIESVFEEEEKEVKGHFFLLPEPGSLEIMFRELGVVF